MKFFSKVVAIVAISCISVGANAGIIKFNGAEVNALNLNGVKDSFVEFYNYNTRFGSAQTGLEKASTIIMFIAELEGDYAIFTIANKLQAGGDAGRFRSRVNSTSGTIEFVDDPSENPMITSGPSGVSFAVSFSYVKDFTDGFVFSIEEEVFDFNQRITSPSEQGAAVGVTGVQFINFTDGSLASAEYSAPMAAYGDFRLTRSVSAPSVLLMLTLALLGLVFRNRLGSK